VQSSVGAKGSPIGVANLRWRDSTGAVHLVDGEHIHPGKTILWTKCGLHDVADAAGLQSDGVLTCGACRIWIDCDPT
jgi:hypothetical protein